MNYSHFIGLDISKAKIDVALFDKEKVTLDLVFKNNPKDLKKALLTLFKSENLKIKNTIVCAEYTGMYIYSIIQVCQELGINLWLENPAQIKLCTGVHRGKSDKIDAQRIALYSYRFQDKAALYTQKTENIQELEFIIAERELLIVDKQKYSTQLKDQKGHVNGSFYKNKANRLKKLLKTLNALIKEIEAKIDLIIKADLKLNHQYKLITSVSGAGKQVAINTIVATQGFTKFDNPRKFACHAGVAPFNYSSGSSFKSKWKVSHRANKKLKKLFHMAALSAIQVPGELREYYLRKIESGKSKMTVINAVRAKIIHRIFAVIKNNTAYEKNYVNSLV